MVVMEIVRKSDHEGKMCVNWSGVTGRVKWGKTLRRSLRGKCELIS